MAQNPELVEKFQAVWGYAPWVGASDAELIRNIGIRDSAWANAATEFMAVYGVAPSADEDAAQLIRRIQATRLDPAAGIDDAPIPVAGDTTIPQGGRVVVVRNPEGSDAAKLWYIVYDWRGVDIAYEVGDDAQFTELLGPARDLVRDFSSIEVISQAQFDDTSFVVAGTIDQKLGQTESEQSLLEREVRAARGEDIPAWIAGSPDALALVATSTANEWSSGKLWTELSGTQAFRGRYGAVIDAYTANGAVTIGDAVQRIEQDEEELRTVLRPFAGQDAASTETLHDLLNRGWTAGFVAQVLEQSETLRRNPDTLPVTNQILEASGLDPLDEVEYLNALNGYGPQETIEALNTATAATALANAGIDLADEDIANVMELVDTSDRLLTEDSWRSLAQELSSNLIRFNTELDQEWMNLNRDDLVAAAFGQESPSGKSVGEVLGLLARAERDRRAAAQGVEGPTGFVNAEGRLQFAGLAGL